jgi:hypothetical protein
MKDDKKIIQEVIEIARKLERTQIRKDELQRACVADTEKALKEREQELLDFDIEICCLGEKLNTLIWLFESEEQ